MIKRIKSLISVKNLSPSQFADLLGVQRSNISHILSGRNKPSLDFILKIAEQFPSISIEWLLKGNGEMFVLDKKETTHSSSQLEIEAPGSNLKMNFKPKPSERGNDLIKTDAETEITPINRPVYSEMSKKEIHEPIVDESIPSAMNDIGIEKIMVLYKNGSFRVYQPQK